MSNNPNPDLIEVRNLAMHFPIMKGLIRRRVCGKVMAVDGVSFSIRKGETMGLVGESGCGKTTTGKCILRLYRPTSGEVLFDGKDLAPLGRRDLKAVRRRMQVIFQDPYGSLNPRMAAGRIVGEPLRIHGLAKGRAYQERIEELFDLVGLSPEMINRYPHEFSGGQRQRIGIAKALAVQPDFIVCDEPISALDVSIQAQVINLLEELQERLNLTFLFIAHDLAVVRHISNRIAVMYLGKIVEIASSNDLYENPLHPYTQALLAAIPIPDPFVEAERKHILLKGEVPSPLNPPSGCRFHPRCDRTHPVCREEEPRLKELGDDHAVACLFVK